MGSFEALNRIGHIEYKLYLTGKVKGVHNILLVSFCIHTYLAAPSRDPLIPLLQVTNRSMILRVLLPTRRQEVGLCTKLDGEDMMPPMRTASRGKNI